MHGHNWYGGHPGTHKINSLLSQQQALPRTSNASRMKKKGIQSGDSEVVKRVQRVLSVSIRK